VKKLILLVDDDPSKDFVDNILDEFKNCEVAIAETVSDALGLVLSG